MTDCHLQKWFAQNSQNVYERTISLRLSPAIKRIETEHQFLQNSSSNWLDSHLQESLSKAHRTENMFSKMLLSVKFKINGCSNSLLVRILKNAGYKTSIWPGIFKNVFKTILEKLFYSHRVGFFGLSERRANSQKLLFLGPRILICTAKKSKSKVYEAQVRNRKRVIMIASTNLKKDMSLAFEFPVPKIPFNMPLIYFRTDCVFNSLRPVYLYDTL